MSINVHAFEERFGPTCKAVSRLIRPVFTARPGKTLVWGDWASVEARGLPWLANTPGANAKLEIFRTNDRDKNLPDIYKINAASIYDITATEVDKDQRQVGKVAELALGFGGGKGALDAMGAGYGIYLEESMQKHIVSSWRASNGWAVVFWKDLMTAFMSAWDHPGQIYAVGRVAYIFNENYLGGTMFAYLPCGRPLTYTKLRREKVRYEDDDTGEMVTEWKIRYQSGYKRKSLWHGILAENITQGACASLLRDLLVRLEKSDWNRMWTVGHTHDECIQECDVNDASAAKARLQEAMEFLPDWAEGLPIVAEITENWFYTKSID